MGLAAKRAINGRVEIGASPAVLGELRSWEYEQAGEEVNLTTMGDGTSTIVPGQSSERVNLGLYLADPTDAQQAQLAQGAQDVDIIIMPFGDTSGKLRYTGQIDILRRVARGDVDGGVELEVEATSPAGLTAGTNP